MRITVTGYTAQEFVKRVKERENEGWTLIASKKESNFSNLFTIDREGKKKYEGDKQKKRYIAVLEKELKK